jgi:hypothetical protein
MEVLNVQEDLGLINSVKNFVEGVAAAVFGKIRIQTKKRVCDRRENFYDARNVISLHSKSDCFWLTRPNSDHAN